MADHPVLAGAVAAILALVLVGVVRGVALRRGVLDHPTDRSSHRTATPRGGGLGLLASALGLSLWRVTQAADWGMTTLLAAAVLVALVGWADDQRGLAVRARLLVHVAAGLLVGSVAASEAAPGLVRIAALVWWTFWSVSSINLVNFMDGINGLVASQIAVFAISIACFSFPASPLAFLASALAGACIGFLPWNFPRARIFLGDVGSGALGLLVPALALLVGRKYDVDIVRAHLPLVPLYADATWTIVRRWRDGERLSAPHRSHLYQRLANGGLGHTTVTIIYAAAAILGALAAHANPMSGLSPWMAGYGVAIVLAGVVLDRYATQLVSRA